MADDWLNALSDSPTPPHLAPASPAQQDASGIPTDIPMMRITPQGSEAAPSQTPGPSWLDTLPDAHTPPSAEQSSVRGIARNIGAGAVESGAGVINTASDPFGNMIGRPLATAAVFAHDALAPALGYERFPADVRAGLLGDTVSQIGTQIVNKAADLSGTTRPEDVQATGPVERIARKATTNAGMLASGGPVAAGAGAVGAIAGDQAATMVPDWAKPAAEMAGNVVGAAAVPATQFGGNVALKATGRVPPVSVVRSVMSPTAQETSVGNTLAGLVGKAPIEESPVGPLNLAQATNNPEIAARTDLAPSYNATANAALLKAQQEAIQKQVGQIGTPSTAADASSSFTNAMRGARQVAGSEENRLWTVPELAEAKVTVAPVQEAMNTTVAGFDPVLRDSMTAQLKALVNRVNDAPGTTIQDLNGVRSGLERISRTSNDGAERMMARELSGAFMEGMDRIPEIAGAPERTYTPSVGPLGGPPPQPVTVPAIAPNQALTQAYQNARDYTRQMRTMFGAPDAAGLLNRNAAGVYTKDASEGARQFFNFSNGSPEGPQSIAQLSDFVAQLKAQPMAPQVAGQMRDAARSYVASALTKAARVEEGQLFNPKTAQDFLRTNGPWIEKSGLFEQSQIDAAKALLDYTDMLRRPEQLLRQVNSATQSRTARQDTFVDQIMSPTMRHVISFGSAIGGGAHSGGFGAIAGTMIGHGFEKAVTNAEGAMRELMAQALLDPSVAKGLMMKASAGNRILMSPTARQAIDAARNAVAAGVASEQAMPGGQRQSTQAAVQ